MKIERINKGQWGKVRAFFDLKTEEGIVIKGFKIVQGTQGPFVGMPSRKNADGEYNDTVFAEREIKDEIARIAMEAYGAEAVQGPDFEDLPPAQQPPAFDDDDIPF